MTTLITGGNSSLARALVSRLFGEQPVRVIDTAFDAPLPPETDVHTGDLCDETTTQALLHGVTSIIHLAPLVTTIHDGQALDTAIRGSYVLLEAARKASVQRVVLGSTLALFDTLPATYRIDPQWRPRPRPIAMHLAAYLAEVCVREIARNNDLGVVCVRVGESTDAAALTIEAVLQHTEPGWKIFHADNARPLHHTVSLPAIPSRPIRNVVIFGAGGPLAAAITQQLAPHYTLRLTDLRAVETITTPQFVGAPLPNVPHPPHEWRIVDVTDAAQVAAACEGMDAIINCTVIRRELAGAFRVNMLGAYHLMQAAVTHRIRRVVHTGPFQMGRPGAAGYDWDTWLVDDVPPRPGPHFPIYFDSKLAGQEICRIFAEYYGLEVPTLLFNEFINPTDTRNQPLETFTVSWADAARAVQAALEIPALPSPFEPLHINADLPHGVFPNTKAKRILNWQPQDDLHEFWHR